MAGTDIDQYHHLANVRLLYLSILVTWFIENNNASIQFQEICHATNLRKYCIQIFVIFKYVKQFSLSIQLTQAAETLCLAFYKSLNITEQRKIVHPHIMANKANKIVVSECAMECRCV